MKDRTSSLWFPLCLAAIAASWCWQVLAQPMPPVQQPKSAKPHVINLTPKQQSLPQAKQMAVIKPQHHFVVLIWHSDYEGMTNVETVIDGATGLPLPAWREKFHGATNSVTFETTNRIEFFRAYNRFK